MEESRSVAESPATITRLRARVISRLAIGKRLRLQGFIVSDHVKEMPAFLAEAIPALQSGKLKNRETFVKGLDAAPQALIDLLHSGAGNIGKMIVELSD